MTLALSKVSRAFGGVRAVDGATFSVEKGEVHGLIGPNGAGKTTLLNLISGLIRPTSGEISLDGARIDGLPAHRIAAQPRVLLLDEPTAGMSAPEADAVARLVREVAREGRAVLLIEHNVKLVMALCDRITVLNFGQVIAAGAPADIANDPAVIDAYLGGA